MLTSCGGRQPPHIVVSVPSLSISRLPYIIAWDQGLYAKYGVDVELWTAAPGSDDGVVVHAGWATRLLRAFGITPRNADVETNGVSPTMIRAVEAGLDPHQIAIASTDCVIRAHIIGRKGIASLAQLKGKRIGVGSREATSGFHALLLAKRMGWDPDRDMVLVEHGEDIGRLLDGSLDAIVGYENEFAAAKRNGLPILADTREWDAAVGGNSALVDANWIKEPDHWEAAKRLLEATIEAISLFHHHPEIAYRAMETWYGIKDREVAQTLYRRGAWIPRKPYPCYEGLAETAKLYDSPAMRRHGTREFYDDTLVREIDAAGFIDALYR